MFFHSIWTTRRDRWTVSFALMFVSSMVVSSPIDTCVTTPGDHKIKLDGSCKTTKFNLVLAGKKMTIKMDYKGDKEVAKTVMLSVGKCKLEGALTVIHGKTPFWSPDAIPNTNFPFPIELVAENGKLLIGPDKKVVDCDVFETDKSGKIIVSVEYTADDLLPDLGVIFNGVELADGQPMKSSNWGPHGFLLWLTIAGGIAAVIAVISLVVVSFCYKKKRAEKSGTKLLKKNSTPAQLPINQVPLVKGTSTSLPAKLEHEQATCFPMSNVEKCHVVKSVKEGVLALDRAQELEKTPPLRGIGKFKPVFKKEPGPKSGDEEHSHSKHCLTHPSECELKKTTREERADALKYFEGKKWKWPEHVYTPQEIAKLDDFKLNSKSLLKFLKAFPIDTPKQNEALEATITALKKELQDLGNVDEQTRIPLADRLLWLKYAHIHYMIREEAEKKAE